MSAFTIFTAGLALLAPFVTAYTTPTGSGPSGNPISAPGLGSIVPVGQPYTIQWTPTTSGTVTLVLLKGPASNLAVVGALAEKINNSGSYSWTPASDLTAGPTADTGYGIQLISDADGTYQYSTQFGISPASSSNTTSSGASSSVVATSAASSSIATSSVVVSVTSSAAVDSASTSVASTTASTGTDASQTVVYISSSGISTTVVTSTTVSATTSKSTAATSTGSVTAKATGAASHFGSGLFGVAAVAGAVVLVV